MKRVLITGVRSYLGNSLKEYLSTWPEQYSVDMISLRGNDWREHSFSRYDCIFHVAGIAHADTGHVSEEQKAMYYRVNTDLAVETAKKAKADGVKQFIFMSSSIVYGDSAPIGKRKLIVKDTQPAPSGFYGDSKVQAEKGICEMEDASFRVVILRPPMIYGKGCKGNYLRLSKFALTLPVFPRIYNLRSMLYVGNFTEFLRLLIDREERGTFWPQNRNYVSTIDMISAIAEAHGKKRVFLSGLEWALKAISPMTGLVNKAFGSFTYDMSMSDYPIDYRKFDFSESIRHTEG